MTATIDAQVFEGLEHRITFRFEPASEPGGHLIVAFADMTPQPELAHVDDFAAFDVHRLFILDDFGVFTDDHGNPGCWYLGEGRSFTFEDDVRLLVDEVLGQTGVDPASVVAVGRGKGGYAALWYALRHGWGHVVAGSPHSRLGRLLGGNGLSDVASFLAGGTSAGDLEWLDRLLFDEIARAPRLPEVNLHALLRDPHYAPQVMPVADALRARSAPLDVETGDVGADAGAAGAAFSAYAFAAIARLLGQEVRPVALPAPEQAAKCRWNRTVKPTVTAEGGGVRCLAARLPAEGDGHYTGLSVPSCPPFDALRLELSFRPAGIELMFVDALDEEGRRVHRWRWRVAALWPPPPHRQAYVLKPGRSFGPFTPDATDPQAEVHSLDVFVKAANGSTVDFTVHSLAVIVGDPGRTAPPAELKLEARAHRRVREGQVLTDAELVNQVAGLVEEGVFPEPVQFPAGPVNRPDVKVAAVLDQFSELGYGYEAQCVGVTPGDFKEVMTAERPDLLLVESAWRGKDHSWNKLVADAAGTGPSAELKEMIAWCRARDIPTVFWNKEDPPNFNVFISAASLFDYIYTTDEDCVPLYKERVGHDRVFALPFAAQPRLHNPVGSPSRRPLDVAFLGTFYARKHPDRKRQVEMVLDPARQFGLHIYSRVEGSAGYAFPLKYQPHLVGTLPYERVIGAYHNYKVLLNVNSVIGSRTMCARRVFEIVACGGSVVSGTSPAIDHVLGPGVVHQSATAADTRASIARLLGDEATRDREAVAGLRRVLDGHTYSDRMDAMLAPLGITAAPVDRGVALVALDPGAALERAVELACGQRHPALRLVIADRSGAIDAGGADRALREAGKLGATVVPVPAGAPDAAALAAVVAAVEEPYVAVVDPAAHYGPNYVTDLVNAFLYTDADAVGKAGHFAMGADGRVVAVDRDRQNRYVQQLAPAAMLIRREALAGLPSGSEPWRVVLSRWQAGPRRLYAADRYNFVDSMAAQDAPEVAVEVFGQDASHATC